MRKSEASPSINQQMGGTQGSEEGQHGGSQKQLAKKPEISSLRHPPKDANPDLVKIEYSNLQALYWAEDYKVQKFPSCFSQIKLCKAVPEQIHLGSFDEVNFPMLSYSVKDLIRFATMILHTPPYRSTVLSQELTRELIHQIALHYNIVSYHNFTHAFSQMLLCYQCLEKQKDMRDLLTNEECFMILLAALAHDLNHNGTNNAFEIKKKTELASLANNESVLEKMHLQELWKILKQNPAFDFIAKSSDHAKNKEFITRLILSTDVAKHFGNLAKLENMKKKGQLDIVNIYEHRLVNIQLIQFFLEQLFHACDIGNSCIEYDSYIGWVSLLRHEFHQQTILQRQANVEVTEMLVYENYNTLYKDQVWFVTNMAYPLWKQLSNSWINLRFVVNTIQTNMKRLQEEMKQQNDN